MPEGYIARIGRLVAASANTLIDSLENVAPVMVMEQTIREIDEAIEEVSVHRSNGSGVGASFLPMPMANTGRMAVGTRTSWILRWKRTRICPMA